ncbi:TPM domain-containing protein [Cryobacterium algoritolerans]|uniref:TPM domain-containing protein n=1 Tax=Cryobacterium algoritolerans TaxID=1259184 RepID=A0A4R8WWG0_9MICO|nr:TPM domain-containing protein [Cryobacterium algoritolerans]TFC19589.1 TPM domain-containing protein [Cryobacterium algoritolerans]
MRSRWLIPVSMAALFAFSVPALAAPTLAWAEDPVTFGASHIADKVGAVTARIAAVNAALDKLYADTRTDLFVVYVDAFTGVADRQQWADKTADDNGLGTNDVLLAIATGDREYQLSVAPDFALTDAQLREVETVAIEPALRVNDWAGAAIGAANGLAAGITGGTITAPEITPGDAAPGRSVGGSIGIVLMILIVIALLVVGAVVFFIVRGRRRPALPPAGTPPTVLQAPPTIELKRRAAGALVQTDDAVKSSEQELGFAIAQYGSATTDAFQRALTTAKAQLTEAFTLQQRLDDSEPDSEEQQRTWYAGIVDLCGRANTALDEQIDDFDALRQLEKKAPAAVASATLEVATIEARVTSADAALAALAARYTDNAIATVADNPRQARERIAFAGAALAESTTRLSAGETTAAAVGVRAAEESIDQARLLIDAVDRLGADLQTATASVASTVTELQADLVTARGLPADTSASGALPGVIAATEQVIGEVTGRLGAARISPLELMQRLEAANTQMDSALQGVRDAVASARRAQAALDQNLLAARAQVSAAEDFITARRGAVGAEARTRLAEAGRLLVEAESASAANPDAALAAAARAGSLAANAITLARNDVNGFSGGQATGGLGDVFAGGGGPRSGGGNGMMGAILGGIIINSILGGGGGFGGGGGGRGGGGRGFGIPGGFGGAATRSRRGGGGRF